MPFPRKGSRNVGNQPNCRVCFTLGFTIHTHVPLVLLQLYISKKRPVR